MLDAFDAPLLDAFAAVVRRGSFTAAAAQLRLSKSVVSERVKQLEARAGVTLLERTTRRLRVTDAGARVLDAAGELAAVLRRVSDALDADRRELTGTLRIATTADLGPALVAPAVARLIAAHPRLRVEILADDVARDPIEARVDVAVRLGAPRASSLTLRRLARFAEPIVAAPAVAEALGRCARPRDLAAAPWVRHALLATRLMRFTGPGGAVDELAPDTRAEASTGATLLALLLAGAGVGCLPAHALGEHLHAGRLLRLCPGWIWKEVTLYALLPPRAGLRPVHRAALAALADQLARDQARWGAAPARSASSVT